VQGAARGRIAGRGGFLQRGVQLPGTGPQAGGAFLVALVALLLAGAVLPLAGGVI